MRERKKLNSLIAFDYVEHDQATPKNRSPSIVSEIGEA